MKLVAPSSDLLKEMATWFQSESDLRAWSGPHFRYPFSSHSFVEDLRLDSLSSFCLVSQDANLLAFGQCYNRLDRCHLGRLVVSPMHRGEGIVDKLIDQLSAYGLKKFDLDTVSLFVLTHNESAIKAYTKYGFRVAEYPEENPLEDCLYMVKR